MALLETHTLRAWAAGQGVWRGGGEGGAAYSGGKEGKEQREIDSAIGSVGNMEATIGNRE